MKGFLLKISGFLLMIVMLLIVSLFFIPDVVSKNSLLAALVEKHEKLEKMPTEKIIFIGGSNASFGLDCKVISAAFKKPAINMGIHAGMGLEYIINDVKPYVKKGDWIILMPEYEHFYTDNFYGEMELLPVLFDIYPSGRKLIDNKQWPHLAKYIPVYAAKKIKSYISSLGHKQVQSASIDIYDKRSFNEFGDAYIHWTLPDQDFASCKKNSGKEKVNPEVISFLVKFKKFVEDNGATLTILPPVLEDQSYQNQRNMIDSIAISLDKNAIGFCAKPDRYMLPRDYFFNSIYHPNKKGIDLRTTRVIEDMNEVITNWGGK